MASFKSWKGIPINEIDRPKPETETNMSRPLKMSIVIPTRDRQKDLADLLRTILDQDYLPFEVIVVDDSEKSTAKQVVDLFKSNFVKIGCELIYVKGSGEGLPAARNLGVKVCRGDVIFFLDDDMLLEKDTVRNLISFFEDNPKALGVQPRILPFSPTITRKSRLVIKFENAVYKALMLTYTTRDKQKIRRSGTDIFPNELTTTINAQRLSGCCCYKREIFEEYRYDENLKLWGFMEDFDFSYRVYKKYPQSLYVIPNAKVIHKSSTSGRLPLQQRIQMMTIYWFYVFFKDVFEGSPLNLGAFLIALLGNFAVKLGSIIVKRKAKSEVWTLFYLLESYILSFKHLKEIRSLRLDFFNNKLPKV
jgi:GT2 family glycosyltransferase